MVEGKILRLSEIVPVQRGVGIMEVPCIPIGNTAKEIRRVYEDYVKKNFDGNQLLLGALLYDSDRGTLTHSHLFALNVLGQALGAENPAFDVTSRADLVTGDVADLAEGCYIDAQDAVVLRGTNKFYDERDKLIFNQLVGHVDNLETPVLLEGLRVRNLPGTGYGLEVVPAEDFAYTHDDSKFGAKGGWFECNKAISRLYRDVSDLYAGRYLAYPDGNGRVVLVSRGANARNLDRVLDEQSRGELLRRVDSVRQTVDELHRLVKGKE